MERTKPLNPFRRLAVPLLAVPVAALFLLAAWPETDPASAQSRRRARAAKVNKPIPLPLPRAAAIDEPARAETEADEAAPPLSAAPALDAAAPEPVEIGRASCRERV